jgi:DNA-3-methyladenine glycosylase II
MDGDDNQFKVVHDKNSPAIRHLCECDKALQYVINNIGDLTYSLSEDGFSFLVDTIIGQMLSNKVANVISARVNNLCEGEITPTRLMRLSAGDLREVGLSNAKAEYILNLSRHCFDAPCFFDGFFQKSDNEIMNELTKIRGIGAWSAKMYLIFVLDRHNILPFEDGAFQQAFAWLYPSIEQNKNAIKKHCEKWSPYSSIASRYLYKVLDLGFTKKSLPRKVSRYYDL